VVQTHNDPEARTAARLVRVETGGVDRRTGKPLKTYFEVTAKVPKKVDEVTRTFAGVADIGATDRAALGYPRQPVTAAMTAAAQRAGERNAELVFLAAQHGVSDLSAPLRELPTGLLRAYRDRGALATSQAQLPEALGLMGVRPFWQGLHGEHTAKVAPADPGTPMPIGRNSPQNHPGEPDKAKARRTNLFREVPAEELAAEDEAVLAATRPTLRPVVERHRYPVIEDYRPGGRLALEAHR
jgi:hypothetical protein